MLRQDVDVQDVAQDANLNCLHGSRRNAPQDASSLIGQEVWVTRKVFLVPDGAQKPNFYGRVEIPNGIVLTGEAFGIFQELIGVASHSLPH